MANRRKYQDLMDLFKEHGYNSQADLARALVQREEFSGYSCSSMASYVSQIFNRKLRPSPKLEKLILELCDNDKRIIDRLKAVGSFNIDVQQVLELKLEEVYQLFRTRFLELGWKGKADMCFDFETFVQSYLAERTPDEKKE